MSDRDKAIEKEKIRRKAAALLPELEEEKDSAVRRNGKTSIPIPVYTPDGNDLVSWFVGITVRDKIASFLQFDKAGKFIRYSSFQRNKMSVKGCPNADTWLDSSHAVSRAKSMVGKYAVVKNSYLSYHQNITRLAWIVRIAGKDGTEKTIYVAGDSVFEGG